MDIFLPAPRILACSARCLSSASCHTHPPAHMRPHTPSHAWPLQHLEAPTLLSWACKAPH
jgi:hypothetical protein